MNDPHVVSLTYSLQTRSSIQFCDPPAVEYESPDFRLRLQAGILLATMKSHFSSADDARHVVDPVLRAWEIDTGLIHGPNAISFTFQKAEVVDRAPSPGPTRHIVAAFGGVAIGGSATVVYQPANYPTPPSRFKVSDEVGWMWYRYEQYMEGKEPLPSMAYAVLTLLEGTTGQKQGARAAICRMYNIDQAVRDKLGDLVSDKGSPAEARKLDHDATKQPLTDAERGWIVAVVKALIRRKAEYDSDPTSPLTQITLADFPPT